MAGGPITLGRLLVSIRLGEETSQVEFAEILGISRQNLCDVEKGRAIVRPERAARWAKYLGYSESQFVALALQDSLDAAGLRLQVNVVASKAKKRRKSRKAA